MTGEISLTCDAWQADNTDRYFAVTGHWIEECAPGKWTLENALLGFTQMNCSHSGVHLGQMLFKVISRLDIVHKVRMLPFDYYRLAHLFLTQVGHAFSGCYLVNIKNLNSPSQTNGARLLHARQALKSYLSLWCLSLTNSILLDIPQQLPIPSTMTCKKGNQVC